MMVMLNPNHAYEFPRGVAMFVMADYTGAIEMLQISFEHNPNFIPSGLYLAASHALAGNSREAEATVADILQTSPNYALGDEFLTQFKKLEDRERFIDGLRKAGLC